MAIYGSYVPVSLIGKAMFNFDAFGISNYKLIGTIRVSTSDSFSYADYLSVNYGNFDSDLYTSPLHSDEVIWSAQQASNIQEILGIYGQLANIHFAWQGDYDYIGSDTTENPEDVGRANVSDINITWMYRPDSDFSGISGASSDSGEFGYVGGAGDIFLNAAAEEFGGDYSLGVNTRSRQVLMHELGHSLGLSHPHLFFANGVPIISPDYALTMSLGFRQLGFAISSPADMYKEYFTIMSYDDQVSVLPGSDVIWNAHTPMILDVIALQEAYGEGAGTSGSGNDTIEAGTAGYRTYFDTGGTDTIDMSSYTEGAYLNMGVTIAGARHLVGVGMSAYDAGQTILDGGDPAHLRWFYGEFENAQGSSWSDVLVGNSLSNTISGMEGDDWISGGEGNDTLQGGDGNDTLEGGAGNDVFDWDAGQRGGNDTMTGGVGDDVYVLDSLSDVIVEKDYEGIDTVYVGFSYSLVGTALENIGTFSDQLLGVTLTGNAWGNFISGGGGDDTLIGNEGDDALQGGGGNDTLDGGAGLDTAMYSGLRAGYTISRVTGGFTVAGPDGLDSLRDIERLKFADVNVALDIDGSAGQACRIYQAAFNRTPDAAGLGYWIHALDFGASLRTVALAFVNSAEFRSVYGASPTNAQLVTQYYENVLHRAPEAGGYNYWLGILDQHLDSASGVLASISESAENKAGVIGVMGNGFVYTPFG